MQVKHLIPINYHKTPMLIDPWHFQGPKHRELTAGSWPGLFRQEILPVLPVEKPAACFTSGRGRPGKDLHTVLGALVLQQQFDPTDGETLRQLAFDEAAVRAARLAEAAREACAEKVAGEAAAEPETALSILFAPLFVAVGMLFSIFGGPTGEKPGRTPSRVHPARNSPRSYPEPSDFLQGHHAAERQRVPGSCGDRYAAGFGVVGAAGNRRDTEEGKWT